jgi:hypothetical protein
MNVKHFFRYFLHYHCDLKFRKFKSGSKTFQRVNWTDGANFLENGDGAEPKKEKGYRFGLRILQLFSFS